MARFDWFSSVNEDVAAGVYRVNEDDPEGNPVAELIAEFYGDQGERRAEAYAAALNAKESRHAPA